MIKRAGLILVPLLAALGAGIVYVSDHYGELIHYAMAGAEFAGPNCPTPPPELMRDIDRRHYDDRMREYDRAMSSFPQRWLCSKHSAGD